jgi:NAD(P) transhydrogenase subunit alpha
VVTANGVSIIGTVNLPATMGAIHASEMYARNLYNFLELMLKDGALNLDWEDELIAKDLPHPRRRDQARTDQARRGKGAAS